MEISKMEQLINTSKHSKYEQIERKQTVNADGNDKTKGSIVQLQRYAQMDSRK